jgi:hypothetical protein
MVATAAATASGNIYPSEYVWWLLLLLLLASFSFPSQPEANQKHNAAANTNLN